MKFKRGELYRANVPRRQTEGHEQWSDPEFPRPYLIVSDDRVQTLGLVVACPLTSQTEKYAAQSQVAPFRVPLTPDMVTYEPARPGEKVKPKPNLILGEQIRVMAVERLSEKFGTLTPEALAKVDVALSLLLRI